MIKNPKTGRMIKRDGVIGKQVLQNAATTMQKMYRGKRNRKYVNSIKQIQDVVFGNPNLRKIIINKAGNATKKDAGIQNFNGRIIHNEALKVLPNWMIPRKESKSNALEAWKSKMKKQTYTSEKRKDLNDIKDLLTTLQVLSFFINELGTLNYLEDNWTNFKNANNIEKTKMLTKILNFNTDINKHYNTYNGYRLDYGKTEKFKRITNILPKLIQFNNAKMGTTNLGKQYYKLILNIPLNKSDNERFNLPNNSFPLNKF